MNSVLFQLGKLLILISALLYISKYLISAIMVSQMDFNNTEVLASIISVFPDMYVFWNVTALVLGILFVVISYFF